MRATAAKWAIALFTLLPNVSACGGGGSGTNGGATTIGRNRIEKADVP